MVWRRSVYLIVVLIFAMPSAQAWSNGGYSADPDNPDYGTHDWIAEQALTIQTRDITFLDATYLTEYLLGTEDPDNPAQIGDSTLHHVYYYSGGTLQDDSSADRASALYSEALAYMNAGQYDFAAASIGAMTHYIADVGVFGHTMGSATDWGSETHHSDYEGHFESVLGSLSLPATSLGNLSAYDATMSLAQKTTFGSGSIKANTWMDANYDWSDPTFEASANTSLYAAVAAVAAAINHLMIAATPLTVTMAASPSNGTEPLVVSFTSTVTGGVSPYSYIWTFGDGGTSTSIAPHHTYNAPGTYNVTLTVTDALSSVAQWNTTITVNPKGFDWSWLLPMALISVIIIVAVLVVIFVTYRRKGPEY